MRELGVWDRCRYPGYSDDPLHAFHSLAHDLSLADDFLCGDAQVLERAALKEHLHLEQGQRDDMAHAVGDVRALEEMHELFRARRYSQVLVLFAGLKYPERLSPAELQMLQIARERSGG
jgi:hypothetical protein